MVILKDIFYLNKDSFKTTLSLFIKNWTIILVGLLYMIISMLLGIILLTLVFGSLSILTGIIFGLVLAAMISNYLYLLQNIIRSEKFTFNDVKYGFTALLRKVYGVLLIGFLARLLYSMVLGPILGNVGTIIMMIVPIALFILINPLPESIYLRYYDPWGTIVYSFDFIKENWLEWFVPNLFFIGILYFMFDGSFIPIFSIALTFDFGAMLGGIVGYIISQVVFSFIMIYRGVLFEKLSTSTRRKRIYMRDLYK